MLLEEIDKQFKNLMKEYKSNFTMLTAQEQSLTIILGLLCFIFFILIGTILWNANANMELTYKIFLGLIYSIFILYFPVIICGLFMKQKIKRKNRYIK
ncbi:MAG TPA: hypothetical protein EYG93_03965 [Sulfurospirillum arcachonense]|nr:hypothetical protein [Sulfurospirillum arcachonense]